VNRNRDGDPQTCGHCLAIPNASGSAADLQGRQPLETLQVDKRQDTIGNIQLVSQISESAE
jgi:hypothetical protein